MGDASYVSTRAGDSASDLIRLISVRCDRSGDLLLDFMARYGLRRLMDATPEQLAEYINERLT